MLKLMIFFGVKLGLEALFQVVVINEQHSS